METPLHAAHVALGARMVDYAGWHMPVQYEGVIAEHKAVRSAAGLFDVSHMGEVLFEGPDAVAVVNRLITNDLDRIRSGRAQYTTICNDRGTILDDAICYRLADDRVLVVVNAANTAKMVAWFEERAEGETRPRDVSQQWALLALQGPKAGAIAAEVIPEAAGMKPFRVREAGSLILASTGYTGERGLEIFVPWDEAAALWERLMAAGAAHGLVAAGLGCRDTLRLEMGYSLYGNDIDETTSPIEAGLGWVVRTNKPGGFIGAEAIKAVERDGVTRRLVGLSVTGRGIARHGYALRSTDGETIGVVTSGTQSPSLGRAIAMAYVNTPFDAVGTTLVVDVRGRDVPAEVVKVPFYERQDG